MSLRPMLFAANIQPLLAAAQSQDLSFVPRIVQRFRTTRTRSESSTLETVEREAARLLSGAVSGHPECEEHVHIIAALAEILDIQSDATMIADGDWKQAAWDAYLDRVKALLDPLPTSRLGKLAQSTRPLFGSSVETSWAYYGYLLHQEVRELLADLNAAAASCPELSTPGCIGGFHNQFTGWLRQAQGRHTDLWLFAS